MTEYAKGPMKWVGYGAIVCLLGFVFVIGAFLSVMISSGSVFAGIGLVCFATLAAFLRTQWFSKYIWVLDKVADFLGIPPRTFDLEVKKPEAWVVHLAGGLFVAGTVYGVVKIAMIEGA